MVIVTDNAEHPIQLYHGSSNLYIIFFNVLSNWTLFPRFSVEKIPTVKITKWAPRDLGVWFYDDDDVVFRIKMCQGATQNKNLTDETKILPTPIK